ncbi:YcxB family protein [Lentzea atacamensis]|nr:YcxB family protein [Lentzea atacamensis]
MSNSVDFKWAPSPADWRASLRAMVPMFKWAPWFAVVLGGFSLVLLFGFDDAMFPVALFGLVCALVIGFMEPVAVWWRFSSDEMISRTVVGSADDQSFRMAVGNEVREEIVWEELPGWTETRQGFVLETLDDGAASLSVPHRAFASDEDLSSFRTLLEQHIGPAKQVSRIGHTGWGSRGAAT